MGNFGNFLLAGCWEGSTYLSGEVLSRSRLTTPSECFFRKCRGDHVADCEAVTVDFQTKTCTVMKNVFQEVKV